MIWVSDDYETAGTQPIQNEYSEIPNTHLKLDFDQKNTSLDGRTLNTVANNSSQKKNFILVCKSNDVI